MNDPKFRKVVIVVLATLVALVAIGVFVNIKFPPPPCLKSHTEQVVRSGTLLTKEVCDVRG